ncbi:MAG: hypothetical protein JWO20_2564 [Candidatus Angelobacter sp.]|nr:hypothetical protein [Candidatus Angelobacter sp.]
MGRSKPEPSFLMSAGARFTVMCVGGMSYPQFFKAARMRSRLSRTAASGKPTVVKLSLSNLMVETSTSTSMMLASIPKTAALRVLNNILGGPEMELRSIACQAPDPT